MRRETEETMLQPAGALVPMVNNRKARRAAATKARKDARWKARNSPPPVSAKSSGRPGEAAFAVPGKLEKSNTESGG